jgi:hypothetical protein
MRWELIAAAGLAFAVAGCLMAGALTGLVLEEVG